VIVSPPLCCEEAAAQAGQSLQFCTQPGGGAAPPPTRTPSGSGEEECVMSVWQNTETKALAIVTSKFGTAGFGWVFVDGPMCCAEAAARVGFPPSFCSNPSQGGVQPAIPPRQPPPPPPPPPLGPRVATPAPGATLTPPAANTGTGQTGGGIGAGNAPGDMVREPGALILTKTEMRGTPDPKTWSVGWDGRSTSGSAQYTYNGSTASYQWSVPYQLTLRDDVVNIGYSASAGPNSNIAPLIDLGGQSSPRAQAERSVGAMVNPNESKSDSKSVPVRFESGSTKIELRVVVGWSFEAVYTYEAQR
jgi:hypothetical protein